MLPCQAAVAPGGDSRKRSETATVPLSSSLFSHRQHFLRFGAVVAHPVLFLNQVNWKVPTKAAFHRHLPAPAAVRARPQAILTALSPHFPAEGADESGISSSPSGTRSRAGPSAGHSDGFVTAFPLRKGADENGNSSAPSGTRSRATPSIGPSHRHISAPPPRRCRRKWRFIVTFRNSRLCNRALHDGTESRRLLPIR